MSEIELLIKLRDAHREAADACEERLEQLAPKEVKADLIPSLEEMPWQETTGPKGPYQKTEDVNSPKYKLLLKALKEHDPIWLAFPKGVRI